MQWLEMLQFTAAYSTYSERPQQREKKKRPNRYAQEAAIECVPKIK